MTATSATPGCVASCPLSLWRSPAQPKGDGMSGTPRRSYGFCRAFAVHIVVAASLFSSAPACAVEPSDIESNLTVTIDGSAKQLSLAEGDDRAQHPGGQHRA